MAHYAKVKNGIVTKVIVAEQDFINNYNDNEIGIWVQTSYNTYGGQHKLGGTPLRKNFANKGYIYDKIKDAFYTPQPFSSWILNEETCLWEAPVAKPDNDKSYEWNEADKSWDVIE